MKNLLPFVLFGGVAAYAIASSNKKPTTYKKKPSSKNEDKNQNEQAILKYFSQTPVKIVSLNDLMGYLTEDLKNTIFEYSNQYVVYIKPEYKELNGQQVVASSGIIMEMFDLATKYIADSGKQVTNTLEADPIVKKVLEKTIPDVYWGEGLTPYDMATPFDLVWKSVGTLVMIASDNLVQKGILK